MLPDMPPGQVRAFVGPEHFLSDAACAFVNMMKAFTCLWMTTLAFTPVLISANGRCCCSPQHVLDASPTAAPEQKRMEFSPKTLATFTLWHLDRW